MDRKLRMAIVGLGTWGINHVRIYQSHSSVDLVAVCDQNGKHAKKIAKEFQIPEYYDDYNQMLFHSNCEAVAIVTPDFAHRDIVIASCRAGKHILVEKPLATTREDIAAILDAIRTSGVRAMVDFHNRWSPPFNATYESIQKGELGDLQSAYFRLNDTKWVATNLLPWAAKSSILWFLGSHSLDTLQWLFNDKVKRVYSVSTEGVLKAEGVSTIDQYLTTIEFTNGAVAQMENGWITPNANPCVNDLKFSITGSKAMISIDGSHNNLIQTITDQKVYNPDVLVQNAVFSIPKGFAFESIRGFVDCILHDKEFPIDIMESTRTTLVILSIMESAENRLPVNVEYL